MLGAIDPIAHLEKRREEAALLRIAFYLRLDRRQDAVDNYLRQDEFRVDALPHVVEIFIEIPRNIPHA